MKKPTPLKLAVVQSGRAQQDIAAEVGIHPSHLSRIVNGLWCDEETREALARVLDTPLSVLWPDLHGEQPDAAHTGSDETGRKAA